jgi:hypothetical protein
VYCTDMRRDSVLYRHEERQCTDMRRDRYRQVENRTDRQADRTDQGRATQRRGRDRETQRKKEEIALRTVKKGGKSGQKCVSSEKDKIGRNKSQKEQAEAG